MVGSARAVCPSAVAAVDEAAEALVSVDVPAADAALARAEEGLGCGEPLGPDDVARLMLVRGAAAWFRDDRTAADEALAAARRASPALYLDVLGDEVRRRWLGAADAPGEGKLSTEPDPVGWTAHVDGHGVALPADLAPGLHVLQLEADGQVGFGKLVRVRAGDWVVLDGPAPRVVAGPAAVVPQPSAAAAPGWSVGPVALVGAALASGVPLDAGDGGRGEPSLKVVLPIEVGALLRREVVWVRATVSFAPLVGGRYVYGTDGGNRQLPGLVGADLAGGAHLGPADVGALLGGALPGRVALRAVGAVEIVGPLLVEVRAGVNVATERAVEPAAGVLLVVAPG